MVHKKNLLLACIHNPTYSIKHITLSSPSFLGTIFPSNYTLTCDLSDFKVITHWDAAINTKVNKWVRC